MLGYYPGKPQDDAGREFVMVSLWRDLDSLKQFAGSHWQDPVVTEEEAPLVEEMHAHHYIHFAQEAESTACGMNPD